MRKTLVEVAKIGVVMAGLALQGCSTEDGTSGSAPAAPSTPVSAGPFRALAPTQARAISGIGNAPPPAGALDGRRQVFFLPRLDDNELPDSVLAVTGAGRIQVTDDYADRALFVPVPIGGGGEERLIKTGAMRAGGEPFCLQVRGDGPDPRTVVTAPCAAAAPAQLFTFEAAGTDAEGRTTYAVRNRDAFLQWHPLGEVGLVADEVGDSPLQTTFSLQDQGPAALPKGD